MFLWKAFAFGDPRMTTLDGLTYAMNGLGIYVLISSDSNEIFLNETITIHGRTAAVLDKQIGGTAGGTIFSGLALKFGQSSIVEVYDYL